MKIEGKRLWWNYWSPVAALCLALFVQSCLPSPDLGPDFPLKDKLLHMAAYGLLAALFYRAGRVTWPQRWSPMQIMALSICFAALYGVSDEVHQAFVSARRADTYDLLADLAGSILGGVVAMKLIFRHRLNG